MDTNTSIVNQIEAPVGNLKRISWGAVFAGVVIAFVTILLLCLLGMAIGLGSIDPVEEQNPFAGLATGAAVWWAFSLLSALFLGGWVAGRLAGVPRRFEAGLHGAITWSIVTILTVYFATSAVGRLIGGATRIVAQGASALGQGAAALTPETGSGSSGTHAANNRNEALQAARAEVEQLLRQTGNPQLQPKNIQSEIQEAHNTLANTAEDILTHPGQAKQEINQLIDKIFEQGSNIADSVNREELVNVLAARTGKSRKEANAIVDRWAASFNKLEGKAGTMAQQAEQKARDISDSLASSMATASFWAFAAITLSGIAGVAGGCVGRPKNLVPIPDASEH
ncbi:MAG: hypothetical protein SFY81_06565 [Verrucomicrobiota bacterium]|nr:hypothetical protein [Verrucomicrobiota bacterium]